MTPYLLGIDLGGTKIEGALLNPDNLQTPLCRTRLPTEGSKGYQHILSQVVSLCRSIEQQTGLPLPPKIGMGTPGITNPKTGKLKNSNTQCLNGEELQKDLEQLLGVQFVMANDANCFALAEATYGDASQYETVFGVILGTGVGGGLVANGKVLNGCHGIAGEWGQVVLDPNGPASAYGTLGTIEAYIAGPALERYYEGISGVKRNLREVAELAAEGSDVHAVATLERLTDTFAQAISIIIHVYDPHAIVLGGGVGNIDALYTEATRQKIAARVFGGEFNAALIKPKLGDSAGVFGAAMLTK
ncbi:MAG: ROK family protein [Candidatus Methylacidiphilales bacterium]|nr:ROK family protein [Candidatus Methylacidiphilales bacterium]